MGMVSDDVPRRDALAGPYAATTYVVVDGFRRVPLRLGARSPDADRLLARLRRRDAFILSADNPGSLRRPDATNRRARLRLPRGLRTEAQADGGGWPVERGVLATVGAAQVRKLLARLRQAAAVRVVRGRPPVLLWSRAGYFGR